MRFYSATPTQDLDPLPARPTPRHLDKAGRFARRQRLDAAKRRAAWEASSLAAFVKFWSEFFRTLRIVILMEGPEMPDLPPRLMTYEGEEGNHA